MQTLRKKNSPCKFKKEPTRFLGEGVSFKAKLIGILEVSEARGDRMCQAALADLKMAIRAAGEHKQRIAVQVSIDGLRLREEKTGECLYHHPVHKISFIAQDMHDSRAFGYIFGSPDTGHRFFGIKTDKAANQVVIAMRDLFQVVFELKKKEIELTKLHIDQNIMRYHPSGIVVEPEPDTKGAESAKGPCTRRNWQFRDTDETDDRTENRGGDTADLLDLQFELNSLQQGIHQMDKITPENIQHTSDDLFGSDPFGDSFTNMRVDSVVRPILPPPPSMKRNNLDRHQHESIPLILESHPITSLTNQTPTQISNRSLGTKEKHFSDTEISLLSGGCSDDKSYRGENSSAPPFQTRCRSPQFDVFTELDPLGTGLSKPYIDKKDFFRNLKNPPKKILKDLVTTNSSDTFPTNFHPLIKSSELIGVENNSLEASEDGDFANFETFTHCEIDSNQQSQSSQIKNISCIHKRESSVNLPPEGLPPEESLGVFERETSEPERIVPQIYLPSQEKNQSSHETEFNIGPPTQSRMQSMEKIFHDKVTENNESLGSPMHSCSSDANSRQSISSVELDIVPEPPPRGSGNILINPPPLPPKKRCENSRKPPLRPPQNDKHIPYDFVEQYEITQSPGNQDSTSLDRGARNEFDDTFLSPKSRSSDEKRKELFTFPSFCFDDSFNSKIPATISFLLRNSHQYRIDPKRPTEPSFDSTVSQLESTHFSELASSLNVPVSEITNLTLHQLAKYLSKSFPRENQTLSWDNIERESSEEHSRRNSSITNEALFRTDSQDKGNSQNDLSHDKYAVIREFLESEQIQTSSIQVSANVEIQGLHSDETTPQKKKINDTDRNKDSNIIFDSDSELGSILRIGNEYRESEFDKSMKKSPDSYSRSISKIPKESLNCIVDETDIREIDKFRANVKMSVNFEVSELSSKDDPNLLVIEKNKEEEASRNSDDKILSTLPCDRYAALREIVVDIFPKTMDLGRIADGKLSAESIPCSGDQDLMKLFSLPSSQTSSPKKEKQQVFEKASTDIFEEIRMLNSDIDHSELSLDPIRGFDKALSSFTQNMRNVETKHDPNWAKFETDIPYPEKALDDGHFSFCGISPWSPEDGGSRKENVIEYDTQQHSDDSGNEWKDDGGSEESNSRLRDESSWSRYPHFDSSYEENSFHDDDKKDRRCRETSKKRMHGIPSMKEGCHRLRTNDNFWHEQGRWEAEHCRYPHKIISYQEDRETKSHRKYKKERPLWSDVRQAPRISERPIHDHEDRKRRVLLWNDDDKERYGSQKSMTYEGEGRWSRRGGERRKWEGSGRFWGRRADDDYKLYWRNHGHCCRDSGGRLISFPPGWEDRYEFNLRGDSTRYTSGKGQWLRRPSSANGNRNSEAMFIDQREYGIERSECDGNNAEPHHRPYRSRRRDDHWQSDPEFESRNDRLYWSEGPDGHSEFIHRKKMNHEQVKKSTTQSSPFEDDFTQTTEFSIENAVGTYAESHLECSSKQSVSSRNDQEHTSRNHAEYQFSSFYGVDLAFNQPGDSLMRENIGTNQRKALGDFGCEPQNPPCIESFVSEDENRSITQGSQKSDDTFAFQSKKVDTVQNHTSTGSLRNSRQSTCVNINNQDHEIKKSESFNIFVRGSDPFDDDFFN